MIATSFTARIVSQETVPVVFQLVFALYNVARVRNCCFKKTIFFCFVFLLVFCLIFFSLYMYIYIYFFLIYFFTPCSFYLSITARACYVLLNQSSLFIVTRTVCSLNNV